MATRRADDARDKFREALNRAEPQVTMLPSGAISDSPRSRKKPPTAAQKASRQVTHLFNPRLRQRMEPPKPTRTRIGVPRTRMTKLESAED
jgi:hypothetical protein